MPACPPILAVLLALTARPGVQDEPPQRPGAAELRARNARLSFTSDSARRARVLLDRPEPEASAPPEARAVALLALACGGANDEVPRFEARLESGEPCERRAALFALAELARSGWPALERALARDTSGLEEALCVALAVCEQRGAPDAGERLLALADGGDRLALGARAARAWRAGEDAGALADAFQLYYELRWSAARAYGYIDGRHGARAAAAERFADEAFLDRVVLAAAAELPEGGLEVHLTEILRSGGSPGALRVAALVMPDRLERAHEAGTWQPSTADWKSVLAEIEEQRAERRAKGLLALAFRSAGELEPLAGRLLFRAGGEVPWSWVRDQVEVGEPELRGLLVEACGERGDAAFVLDLALLLERGSELGISAEGLVALARLGHPPARKTLEQLVQGPPSPERDPTLVALARVLHDLELRPLAEQAMRRDDLAKETRLELMLGLGQNGVPVDRGQVRTVLASSADQRLRRSCARVLALSPELADLEAMAALFPVADDLDLDVELALVLLRERQPAVSALVPSALWSAEWNRSVLAGGLIVAHGGTRALLDEIENPPRAVGESDLRRAGFALGEWGGIGAVEELARVRSEGDPVLQGALFGALSSPRDGGVKASVLGIKLDFPVQDEGGGLQASDPSPKAKPKKRKPKKGS